MPAEFIQRPDDALTVFQHQLQSAEAVAVRAAHLTVRLPNGVTPKRAVRVLPLIAALDTSVMSEHAFTIPLGDLERDTPQGVLVEVMVENKPAGVFRIAQAELSYELPDGSRATTRDDATITFVTEQVPTSEANGLVMNYAEKANAHRLVTKVLDEYKTSGKVTIRLSPSVTKVLDPETQRLLDQLQSGAGLSPEQVKSIGSKTRKLTQQF